MIVCASPSAQFYANQDEIEAAVLRVMRSDRYILGEEVEALEQEFANYIGVSHAVGVANGTDALELALRALGIGADDEVITVSHTAVATVAAIEAVGAKPVLVDIDPDFYTLNTEQLSDVLSSKTKVVIAVHLYGHSADLDTILQFCNLNSLALIEDVSQAHGATWRGKKLGSFGDISCFSCYPTKNLGAIGDAGLVTTDKVELYTKLRGLRAYGWSNNNSISQFPGRNSRLDEIQAAILRIKLKNLDRSNAQRQRVASYYESEFCEMDDLKLPQQRAEADHVFHLFVIQTASRDELKKYLQSNGVFAGVHYPAPVHLQPAYLGRIRHHQEMGVTEGIKDKIISLPLYPEFPKEQQSKVVDLIKEFFV